MRKWLRTKVGANRLIDTNHTFLGGLMHHQYLWHFTRHHCTKGVAVGLFWAMQPIPFQMIPATLCAFLLKANLPLALACVWISNPITMAPMMLFNYFIGVHTLNMEMLVFTLDITSPSSWWHTFLSTWQPLLLGSCIVGTVCATIGYFGVNLLWRITLLRRYKRRSW